jgi:hydroxylamine reductase (hybrid-cluster protein)
MEGKEAAGFLQLLEASGEAGMHEVKVPSSCVYRLHAQPVPDSALFAGHTANNWPPPLPKTPLGLFQ